LQNSKLGPEGRNMKAQRRRPGLQMCNKIEVLKGRHNCLLEYLWNRICRPFRPPIYIYNLTQAFGAGLSYFGPPGLFLQLNSIFANTPNASRRGGCGNLPGASYLFDIFKEY